MFYIIYFHVLFALVCLFIDFNGILIVMRTRLALGRRQCSTDKLGARFSLYFPPLLANFPQYGGKTQHYTSMTLLC